MSGRSRRPVLVLGGTGRTGRRVAEHLLRKGHTPRVASRSGVVRFDWNDQATWAAALDGTDAAYLVSAAGTAPVPAFVRFAEASGVRRLVLLSARAWERADDPGLLAVERAVREYGSAWTILRPTWFAQNFTEEPFLRQMVASGMVELSAGSGLVPFVDAEDIAEVAAAVLTEPGHAERIYELSGPRLLSFGDGVAELAGVQGRAVRYRPVSGSEFRARLREQGRPTELAEFLDLMLGWVADGAEEYLSDGVRQVLGREARDFGEYLHRGAVIGLGAHRTGDAMIARCHSPTRSAPPR